MKHYLFIDKHNNRKGHHISFNDEGDIFYNQAVHYENSFNEKHKAYLRDTKNDVPNYENWVDFYPENELVLSIKSHGYSEYINKALRQYHEDRPLEVGDGFDSNFNQADRLVEVIGVLDNEAFGHYEMPNGRVFCGIFEREGKKWKRSQAFKSIPKKWLGVIDSADIEYLAQQN